MTQHQSQLDDYERVRDVLSFITGNWRDQPTLEVIAGRAKMSPDTLQRLFLRWAGLTPKAFLQALTLDHAKAMLKDSASILDATYDVGMSGPGRLHDLFVTHEAMPPLPMAFILRPSAWSWSWSRTMACAAWPSAIPVANRQHLPT
jgi:AraC family transcriptional regulator, regulatory protein of adaptative response / methylated-DNA-[protein]-cysteine methyltransferase